MRNPPYENIVEECVQIWYEPFTHNSTRKDDTNSLSKWNKCRRLLEQKTTFMAKIFICQLPPAISKIGQMAAQMKKEI